MRTLKISNPPVAGIPILSLVSLWLLPGPVGAVQPSVPRECLLLDFGWRFHLGDRWGTGEDLAKAVAVKNNEAQGGLNKGVKVVIQDKLIPPDWRRSAFNGLAQIILQSTKEPDELRLTVRADGIAPANLSVRTQLCPARPTMPRTN